MTGLSTRVKERDIEKHFSAEGKVEDVRLVLDPWTHESRGFGFVTMSSVEEADRCIKSLNRSILEGRVITVEKVEFIEYLLSFVESYVCNFRWYQLSVVSISYICFSNLISLKVVCLFRLSFFGSKVAVCSSSSPKSK